MPSPVPTPVAAVLGIVPTVLDGFRALPAKAIQFPIFAVSGALSGLDAARRGYDDLAERGERLLERLRGTSFDELEDRVEDVLARTPLAAPYDRAEDAIEDVADTVTAFVRSPKASAKKVTQAARTGAAKGLDAAADTVENLADSTGPDSTGPDPDEEPKGQPTPKATKPDSSRVASAATPDVIKTVEQVSSVIGGIVLDHDELPLPDYDHLTLGALRGRMRSLDLPQLVALRDYEKAKANRLPVVTMLDNRIAKLVTDPTAPLSGGDASAHPVTAQGGSKVSPVTAAPDTASPRTAFGGLGGPT
ncbi:MAG: hypothetical protein H7323_09995 [Frankiales bacterium]|nr:hypothetical protein [Frankiales bacterium]